MAIPSKAFCFTMVLHQIVVLPYYNLWQMSFKDINGLVQQNVQLRNQVHMLSVDLDKKDMELRASVICCCFFTARFYCSICQLLVIFSVSIAKILNFIPTFVGELPN